MIHYQVVGRGLAKLSRFNGTDIFDLKSAIKDQELLPIAASQLKLFVREPTKDKKDLDNLRKAFQTERGKSFDFSRLLNVFEIDEDNPISVEISGK